MKRKHFVRNGFAALSIALAFTQCAGNSNPSSSTTTPDSDLATGSTTMKIAYVEIDSLLTKYNFWNDLSEMMIKKEENIRTTINERAKSLEKDAQEFQRKLENNGFATRERAEQEQARLYKKQQDLQALQQKLSEELATENQKNSLQLRDSINSFLKSYNQDKGYDLIISNSGLDNLLYANPAYNITQEITEGLNKRYSPSAKK
ncbi:MAG: OmpH family outer membrane protein [Phocaeicola sp.]